MRFSGKHLSLMLSALLVASAFGCTIETDSAQNSGNSSGGESPTAPVTSSEPTRIQIDGSSTVKVITAAIAEEFESKFADVKIALKVTGTGTGFKEMIAGRIDIANASRAIKESEKADCAKNISNSWNCWSLWTD
jgi:phosphate transport system substrate-binding protein